MQEYVSFITEWSKKICYAYAEIKAWHEHEKIFGNLFNKIDKEVDKINNYTLNNQYLVNYQKTVYINKDYKHSGQLGYYGYDEHISHITSLVGKFDSFKSWIERNSSRPSNMLEEEYQLRKEYYEIIKDFCEPFA